MITRIIFFITAALLASELSFASETSHNIRFRSIIYFQPEQQPSNISEIESYYSDFKIVDKLPEHSTQALISFSSIENIKNDYPIPDLSYLSYFGRGLDKQQADSIQEAKHAVLIDISYPKKMSYSLLKSANRSLLEYSKSKRVLLWDSETRELFTPDAWEKARVNSWDKDIPIIENHTVIHAYKNNNGVRAITLGMAKFGLPDIVSNDFVWSLNRPMGNLINLVGQSMVEGSKPNKDGFLNIEINNLSNTNFKKVLVESIIGNATSDNSILIGDGKWEDGDPDNYIIELLFSNAKGDNLSEKRASFLSSLFGSEDEILFVDHNEMIEAASMKAKKRLNSLKAEFNKGLNPGDFIQLKAPFKTPDGSREWMWVEVTLWKEEIIQGLLKNEPFNIPSLRGGSEVLIYQEDVFDYIINYNNGTSEGNETGKLISKYQN